MHFQPDGLHSPIPWEPAGRSAPAALAGLVATSAGPAALGAQAAPSAARLASPAGMCAALAGGVWLSPTGCPIGGTNALGGKRRAVRCLVGALLGCCAPTQRRACFDITARLGPGFSGGCAMPFSGMTFAGTPTCGITEGCREAFLAPKEIVGWLPGSRTAVEFAIHEAVRSRIINNYSRAFSEGPAPLACARPETALSYSTVPALQTAAQPCPYSCPGAWPVADWALRRESSRVFHFLLSEDAQGPAQHRRGVCGRVRYHAIFDIRREFVGLIPRGARHPAHLVSYANTIRRRGGLPLLRGCPEPTPIPPVRHPIAESGRAASPRVSKLTHAKP